ncbi:glucose-1-phosphate cytidylyltransferase [Fictibacillus macauensis ZFHKF-1]|uniref:Glucose-1-phosphate cytidylyltransferase n=1 Tax=Fictibacillus macauensis ZFHKF-1 TaxID=1196324 RepID=I8UCV6_9BACL|nr:glucose-1-phosphate cytidylyltransferase [Fictibacillus macauensis]EIT84623.1 glucose-1-phosphate cytidylyltransferase [Fictibacillus macauensis ZFHKF-1]
MKAVILAGGYGTRIAEETHLKPKPMIEIGGKPILWHIMKMYASHGIQDFIICLGYKGYVIKEYFTNYFLHMSDVTFDLSCNERTILQNNAEPWKVTLIDTGEHTNTGGRIKRIQEHVGNETFCLTYGDGLADVNISELIQFHFAHGNSATITAVMPPGRFGALELNGIQVTGFQEKPQGDGNWINGGFFVLEPSVFSLISSAQTAWEKEPLESLAKSGELQAFRHSGFWHPMDTLRDRMKLNEMWEEERAPWKVW